MISVWYCVIGQSIQIVMNQIVHIKNVKQNNLTLTPNFKNQPCENDNSSFVANFF